MVTGEVAMTRGLALAPGDTVAGEEGRISRKTPTPASSATGTAIIVASRLAECLV
jgi:hypothetical protein